MVDAARARKLAVRIRQVVATTLDMQVKDPRLAMVTITDARVTPDLREATLYYTVYGDDEARAGSAMALESAKGVLRSQVGRQTGVKFTPSLTFVADEVPSTARHLDVLLARARAADEEVSRAAASARPAGDPDPYRVPRGDADDGDDPAVEEPVAGDASGGLSDPADPPFRGGRAGGTLSP
jgi:ribosome-binding factor A